MFELLKKELLENHERQLENTKFYIENGFCERADVFTVPVKDNPRAALPEKLAEYVDRIRAKAVIHTIE